MWWNDLGFLFYLCLFLYSNERQWENNHQIRGNGYLIGLIYHQKRKRIMKRTSLSTSKKIRISIWSTSFWIFWKTPLFLFFSNLLSPVWLSLNGWNSVCVSSQKYYFPSLTSLLTLTRNRLYGYPPWIADESTAIVYTTTPSSSLQGVNLRHFLTDSSDGSVAYRLAFTPHNFTVHLTIEYI